MHPVLKYALIGIGVIGLIWLAQTLFPQIPMGPRIDSLIPVGSSRPDAAKADRYPRAKDLVNPSGWINTEPFTIADLIAQGNVVMVDFWTYSCINCQRTFPYLNEWYGKYKDQGLVIVGVHTPEFAFEKDIENVQAAVEKYGIKYPVVLDNDYGTWQAYQNQYWPRKYLIDVDGYIVYDHIGEGGYEETERMIQELLAERAQRQGNPTAQLTIATPSGAVDVDFGKIGSPEMYLGAFRNDAFLGNAKVGTIGEQTLTMPPPSSQSKNLIYLSGRWAFEEQSVRCVGDCTLRVAFRARRMHMVAESASPQNVQVSVDGTAIGSVQISDPLLYTLFEGDDYTDHVLELQIPAGVELFAFTFG